VNGTFINITSVLCIAHKKSTGRQHHYFRPLTIVSRFIYKRITKFFAHYDIKGFQRECKLRALGIKR